MLAGPIRVMRRIAACVMQRRRTSVRWCSPAQEETPMKKIVRVLSILAAVFCAAPATALDNIKILVPANPGGGWDQTGRALAQAMQAAKLVKSVKIDNRGGAGGTIGIAQFVNSAKGDP